LSGVALNNVTRTGFISADFTGANFTKFNLTGASFTHSNMASVDFNGAIIKGADFSFVNGFTADKLMSTASYASSDLSGVGLGGANLNGVNFASFNLTSANLSGANLFNTNFTNANLTGADLRSASSWSPVASTITHDTIRPDGSIQGLALLAGETLIVRKNAKAITVNTSATFDSASLLQFVLDDAWTSPMGFSPGVNPALNGTLDLEFAADISPGVQVGHYFQLFDWTGVQPTGSFTIVSPYEWGLSDLYTDGKVVL